MLRSQIENIEKILNQPHISETGIQELKNNILGIKNHIANNNWQIQIGTITVSGNNCTRVVVNINYLLLKAEYEPNNLPRNFKNNFAI